MDPLILLLSLGTLAVAVAAIAVAVRLQRLSRPMRSGAGRVHESEERFRLIAENLREAIWISDPDYTEQYYLSPAYEAIWGRPLQQARRNPRSFLESVVPEDRDRVERAMRRYAQGEYRAEYRIRRPDGGIRWIYARAYPVRDEAGRVYRIAGIAEDITERKESEEERERLLERARAAQAETEAALRVRDRVLRIVSHDLKNPLHTIGMAAALLDMPLPDDKRARQIEIIERSVQRANRLVFDLLDAARIESGQAVAIQPVPMQVKPLLSEAVEAFRLQSDEKGQELACEIVDGVQPVLADPDRMLQALSNLLGNAVKFTPRGGRVAVRAEPDGPMSVRFSVADTGPGIPPDLLPHLFEPFAQARDTATLGSGLGLAIAHGIIEAHGGHLRVQSAVGQGTAFSFTLEAARPDRMV